MCGIVGYFVLSGDSPHDLPRLVADARDRMTHRGPDDAGLYASPDGRCVLGCRRLAIRDRSIAGRQPMSNEDGTVSVVCNGEIYNADDLRRELEDKGHRFRSTCDVEVIVHLFEEHGPDLVHRLEGMFSLVVHDVVGRRLFGARDRLGKKPLYYAHSPRRFAFASEPKALLALPDVSRQPRIEQLPSYLAFNCVPGPPTLHRDIEKLPPGTRFEVSSGRGLRRDRFWIPPPTSSPGSPVDVTDAVGDSLERSVRKRTTADVRVGAALSGGVDSGLVVALMSEALGTGVPTFTIGYPGDEANPASDVRHARVVAERFATEHHELILDRDAFGAVLDDLPGMADDPIGAPSQAALAHLARHARAAGVTVLQVGEGSDEAFGGYAHAHRLCQLHERLSGFGRLLPRRFAGMLSRAFASGLAGIAISASPIGSSDGTLLEALRRYAKGELVYWGHGIVFCPPEQERLFGERLPPDDPYDRLRERVAALPGFRRRPFPDQVALVDMLLELPERLLMRLDRATMQHGVEARAPFLDPDVLAAAFRVPPAVRTANPKGVLRAYAGRKLPAAILHREKVGFPTSATVFTAPEVLARMRERALARPFLELTGFAPDRVRELLAACERRPAGFAHAWSLYTLGLWFHHWV